MMRVASYLIHVLVEYTGLFVLAGIIWLYLTVSGLIERERLNLLPSQLEVSKIIYAETTSGGFGPGANPAGLIVYEMPDKIALQMMASGEPAGGDLSSIGSVWRRTPAHVNGYWGFAIWNPSVRASTTPTIGELIWATGNIEEKYREMTEQILTSPGNWYSAGGGKVLVLAPAVRRVIYSYQH